MHGVLLDGQHGHAGSDADARLVVRRLVGRLHGYRGVLDRHEQPEDSHGDVRSSGDDVRLSVATAGGSVTSDVPGVECGDACVAAFGAGVDVTLTPWSGPVAWGGACTGSDALRRPHARANAVTASIAGAPLERVPLAVSKTGKGSIVGSSPGIACGETCGVLLAIGARMTLRAIPDPGWTFAGWSGSCRGVAVTCTLAVRAAASAVASFVEAGTLFPWR